MLSSRFTAPFFVLRAPLLPFDVLNEWAAVVASTASTTSGAPAFDLLAQRSRLRQSYRALLDQPVVREAIFIASPDLDAALEHWHRDPDGDRGQAAERALTRYFTRMASRPTPFGLFGSTAVGQTGDATTLHVAPAAYAQRHTRLDMDYLVLLVDALQRRPEVRAHLRYRPNSSLYRAAGRWRYVETRLTDKVRSHHLVSLEPSDALDASLARARAGAAPAALTTALVAPGITADEAAAFVDELIDSQVLTADLACTVTGDEPLGVLVARLGAIPPVAALAATLADAGQALAAIDASPLGGDTERYSAIAERLQALPAKVDLARLFQADLVRPAGATLGADDLASIARGVQLLHTLQTPVAEPELERLKAAWTERFEEREVPLSQALDSDAGLGSVLGGGDRGSSPLLDALDFPLPPRYTVGWGARERHLLDLVGRALQNHAHELALSDDDVRALTSPRPVPLPDAYAAMVTLVGQGARPPRVLMHGVMGPSGARLLGRFCHGDADLAERVRDHLRAEEALDPDAIFAEVVHLPEGRIGNVILRPALRQFEIPFLGASGVEAAHQIAVDDLTVQLTNGRFVLRSIRLGRRIVPRLTCAHNFAFNAVGVYRFLCLLQADGRHDGGGWDWGPLAALPFLPRVRVGNIVLSRAAWRMTKADITSVNRPDATARFAAVQAWRAARRLPRWVVLADYDNTLPVDLDNVLAVDSLVHLVKGRDEATLLELYPGPDDLVAHGPDGAYAHELVVPFVREAAAAPVGADATVARPAEAQAQAQAAPRRRAPTMVTRSFAPGSEWVFAKLYGAAGEADRALTSVVAPLSRRLLAAGAIDRWFFIRYLDPDEHIRWRLQTPAGGSPARVRLQVERAIQGLIDDGLVRRGAFDTYEREVERYGGADAITMAEQWFWADSDCTVEILDALARGGAAPDDRWRAGALGVDRLLADLGCDLAGKAAVLAQVREGSGAEFHVDATFKRALGEKFRPLERPLEHLLVSGPEPGSVLAAVETALARRRRRSRAALGRLSTMAARGRLRGTVAGAAPSYVHMTLNRLFRSEQRMHELVLYDFLSQLYLRRLKRASAIPHPSS